MADIAVATTCHLNRREMPCLCNGQLPRRERQHLEGGRHCLAGHAFVLQKLLCIDNRICNKSIVLPLRICIDIKCKCTKSKSLYKS